MHKVPVQSFRGRGKIIIYLVPMHQGESLRQSEIENWGDVVCKYSSTISVLTGIQKQVIPLSKDR